LIDVDQYCCVLKRRRIMAATDVRVHLGEVLRSLDKHDVIVEKDGMPVAIISRFPESRRRNDSGQRESTSRSGVSSSGRIKPSPKPALSAEEAERIIADIYRWRDEGAVAGG
jgi:hypothetical protein